MSGLAGCPVYHMISVLEEAHYQSPAASQLVQEKCNCSTSRDGDGISARPLSKKRLKELHEKNFIYFMYNIRVK